MSTPQCKKRYWSCANDDEYILSAYAPYIEETHTSELSPNEVSKLIERARPVEDPRKMSEEVRIVLKDFKNLLYSVVHHLGQGLQEDANVRELESGIGRSLLDYFQNCGLVVGVEWSFNKAFLSKKILKTKEQIPFLVRKGFTHKRTNIKGFNRQNVRGFPY